jgi:hypothetical protein
VLQLILEYARLATTADFTNGLVIAVFMEEVPIDEMFVEIQRRLLFVTPPQSEQGEARKQMKMKIRDFHLVRPDRHNDGGQTTISGLWRSGVSDNDGRPYQTQTNLFRRRSYWPMQRFTNQNTRTSTSRRICLSIIIMATCSFIRMDWIHIDLLWCH